MEYYHYVNIFETKGLEYILVVCFLITFVFFVHNLNKSPKWQRRTPRMGPPQNHFGETVIVPKRRETRTGPHGPDTSGEPRHPTGGDTR